MISFKRRDVVEVLDTTADTVIPISTYIQEGKLRIRNRTAVIVILSKWAEYPSLWKWEVKNTNKGIGGYPLSLVRGIRLLDKLLMGELTNYPLYDQYTDRRWRTVDICYAIEQLNLAATDPAYHPSDPERKKYLQRMSLENFIYNGNIKGDPKPYTHAPFLFFVKGAVLNENTAPKKAPQSVYLFDAVFSLYLSENGLTQAHRATNKEHNKLVAFTDNLLTWYKEHKDRLHPNDRNIDIIVHVMQEVYKYWTKPISMYAFTSAKAKQIIIERLTELATYEERHKDIEQPAIVSVAMLNPTDVLSDVANGDYIGTLCVYGRQQNIVVSANSIDPTKLMCFSNFTLRQVLRKWQRGELSPDKKEVVSEDWRTILANS